MVRHNLNAGRSAAKFPVLGFHKSNPWQANQHAVSLTILLFTSKCMDNETDVTHNAFAGFARVELSQLVYEGQKLCEYVNKQPSSVRKRVNKLVKVFEHEGCIREERHAIHIIISQDELEDQQFPKELPVKVAQLPRLQSKAACIHGIHRALAGCEHLAPNDQWWIARVFTECKRVLRRCFTVSNLASSSSNQREGADFAGLQ